MSYDVVRRIGRGGMGVVDLGVDEHGQEVALKRLSLHGTPEELATARQRIKREAEVLRALDHPGIVRLRDVVDDGDDLVLVMDHLSGGTLAQRVTEDGPLPADEVDELTDRLVDALAAAHRQGIVHRDIKPANVLFDAAGQPHLADFGAASTRDITLGLTGSEMVVGTPGFMSPEQARGEPATTASDVFSLGATLAFAATGSGPFGTADPRVLMLRAAAGRVERLPRSMPAPLRRRIEPTLHKNPERRPTAGQLAGGPAGTHPRTASRRVLHRLRGRTGLLVGGAAIALAVVIGLIVSLADGNGSSAASQTAQRPATTTCEPGRFQPCGEGPAPHTDGERCLTGYADYDDKPTNGCEAAADHLPDRSRINGLVKANLVPADDVDVYRWHVGDGWQLQCNGTAAVTLTAPRGASQRVTVLHGADVLKSGASTDGTPIRLSLRESDCGGDDSADLLVRVESVGSDRTAEPYGLEVAGSF